MIALSAITHRDKLIRARKRAKEMIDHRADTYFSQPNTWPPIEHGIMFFGSFQEAVDYIMRERREADDEKETGTEV